MLFVVGDCVFVVVVSRLLLWWNGICAVMGVC